jgi:CRP/FNR family transcriptional regulator, cyclic AMP receptor protein
MATAPDTDELLAKTHLFAGLPRPALSAVAGAMRGEAFTAGQTVFSRSEPGASLYLMTSGRARLSVTTPDGRELTLRMAETGDIFGEIAVLDDGARTADATALTDVTVATLTAKRLAQLMDDHPVVVRTALKFVCSRLRDTTTQLEEIALYPIERRVARFLLSAVALGGHDPAATDVSLDLKMNQTELALLLGASRPKVNVSLGALTEAGAITRKGDLIVCHTAALRAFAGME